MAKELTQEEVVELLARRRAWLWRGIESQRALVRDSVRMLFACALLALGTAVGAHVLNEGFWWLMTCGACAAFTLSAGVAALELRRHDLALSRAIEAAMLGESWDS